MIVQPIDPNWKDWIQTLSWVGAVIGLILALLKYVSEQKQNREQRVRELEQSQIELRWKQAEAAKKLLDEMLSDSDASAAMKMLDWNDVEFEVKPGLHLKIGEQDYVKALRVSDFNFGDKEQYIRDCFDSLFYYMAMIEHYIYSDLVRLEDVAFPLDYFLRIINRNRVVFDTFLEYYKLNRATRFMKRLNKYKEESPAEAARADAIP
ncbi:MAG: hypothetical protein QOC96_561 [Acidobacteriota bacterium]|jgi:hypothetical protein|nr:hypothetical protein [Acidobacteriota bacterium]